jgi:ATP-dependent Clp protease ATP-binding subunit ClpX
MMDAMFSMPSSNKKALKITLDYAKEQLSKSSLERMQVS